MVRMDECRDRLFRSTALDRAQHLRVWARTARASS